MSLEINVFIRNVYGQSRIYPSCATAKQFAKLVGTLTFSISQIADIKALGYEVWYVMDPKAEAEVRQHG